MELFIGTIETIMPIETITALKGHSTNKEFIKVVIINLALQITIHFI